MLRSRTLNMASVLVCALCAASAAHAVPVITDWSQPLAPAAAPLPAPAPPLPGRNRARSAASTQTQFSLTLTDAGLAEHILPQEGAPGRGLQPARVEAFVLTLTPASHAGTAAGTPPPSLSSQLSLWSTAPGDAHRPTSFAGAPALDASLAPASTAPTAYRFPLKADALHGLPAFASTDTSLASFLLPVTTRALPEPGLHVLFGLGLLGLAASRRNRPAH